MFRFLKEDLSHYFVLLPLQNLHSLYLKKKHYFNWLLLKNHLSFCFELIFDCFKLFFIQMEQSLDLLTDLAINLNQNWSYALIDLFYWLHKNLVQLNFVFLFLFMVLESLVITHWKKLLLIFDWFNFEKKILRSYLLQLTLLVYLEIR